MDRRTLLQLFGGVAVAGARPFAFQAQPRRRIVIAGGGILGANIAHQLAKRGASVTLLDRARPATGATANSFAWINAKKQPHPYFTLSQMGIEAWRELHAEIGRELPVRWGGSLEWTSNADHATRQAETMRRFQAWGYPVHLIDEKQLRALEPNVVPGARGERHARRDRRQRRSGRRHRGDPRARRQGGGEDRLSGGSHGPRHAERPSASRQNEQR